MELLYGNKQQLVSMAGGAQDILATARAVFPFDFFPDSIVVSRTKVTVHHHLFFGQTESLSLQVEDILSVELDTSPMFARLKIFSRVPNQPPLYIRYLPRKSAVVIQSVIEGYNIARAKKVDCSTIPKNDLIPLLRQLGYQAKR